MHSPKTDQWPARTSVGPARRQRQPALGLASVHWTTRPAKDFMEEQLVDAAKNGRSPRLVVVGDEFGGRWWPRRSAGAGIDVNVIDFGYDDWQRHAAGLKAIEDARGTGR